MSNTFLQSLLVSIECATDFLLLLLSMTHFFTDGLNLSLSQDNALLLLLLSLNLGAIDLHSLKFFLLVVFKTASQLA